MQKTGVVVVGAGLTYLILDKLFESDQSGGTSDTGIGINMDNLTYPVGQYQIFADGIENAIFGSYGVVLPWEDDQAIADVLANMHNNDDVYFLIKTYGRRYVGVFIEDGGNLVQMINTYLDKGLKHSVNKGYRNRGITALWP